MPARIPERLTWAVEQLDVQPDDHVLEIGCGTGVAASLICARLAKGRLTAIDRSPKAISAAQRRNAGEMAAGKATFQLTSLADAELGRARFHRALAVHVNLFWLKPAAELQVLRKALKPGGPLCLVYQPFTPAQGRNVADTCARFLREHGLTDIDVITGKLREGTVVCIRASAP